MCCNVICVSKSSSEKIKENKQQSKSSSKDMKPLRQNTTMPCLHF